MSRTLGLIVSYVIGAYTGNWWLFASQLYGAKQDRDVRQARRRAIAEYNAAQTDRQLMRRMEPNAPRGMALGRIRGVEGVRREWTSGANSERLTQVISFCGHQVDGFEAWYLDDTEVTLDGSGWVTTAPWNQVRRESAAVTGTLDGSGNATLTVPADVVSGTAAAVWGVVSESAPQGTAAVSISGTTATVTGGQAGERVTVSFERDVGTSYVRIRAWGGGAGQNVGATLAAEYPGEITSSDRFEHIALAVMDVIYNPDVMPQGPPNLSALYRGARVYDPRLDSTVPGGSGSQREATPSTWAWSENPALLAYHYARAATGWDVPADEIRTADVMTAANACDVATDFTLRMPDDSTEVVNLPRYRAGIYIAGDADPRQAMDELMDAMAGSEGWAGGLWRMRAGVLNSPVFDVTADWLAQPLTPDGTADADTPVVRMSNGVPRDQRINRVSGQCADPAQRWQVLPFPAVEDPVLIAAKGLAELEVQLPAVNHVAHAQHLASVRIRQAQAPLRMELACGLQAWGCELLDVGTVTLPRYGMTGKTVEVTGWRWHPTELVRLQLAEITQEIFDPLPELTGRDPAPNGTLRRPWDVETLAAPSVESGTVALRDGSIITRTRVTWTAAAGQGVRLGGHIEVQYALAAQDLPAGEWQSWKEPGDATEAVIPGLLAGAYYRFRVRAVQAQPFVRGNWSPGVLHQVAAPPFVNTFVVEFSDDDGVVYSNIS